VAARSTGKFSNGTSGENHSGINIRHVGVPLLEQNDEWAIQRARNMTLETIAPLRDDPTVNLPAIAG